MMPGRASGVWRAALWKRTMEPGWTLAVTRLVMSAAERSFQSRLSPLAADARGLWAYNSVISFLCFFGGRILRLFFFWFFLTLVLYFLQAVEVLVKDTLCEFAFNPIARLFQRLSPKR